MVFALIASTNVALGRWLGAGVGVMLLVMAGFGVRDFRRGGRSGRGGRWPRN